MAEIIKVTIRGPYQSARSTETKYRRLRLSGYNKLFTISQLLSSA